MYCRNCLRRKANRPRGLCVPCYYTPSVLARFPVTSKFAPRSFGHVGGYRLPVPALVFPGTEEKLAIMEQRARAGESLFHPDEPRLRFGQRAKVLRVCRALAVDRLQLQESAAYCG
jgi:hypothetical protein